MNAAGPPSLRGRSAQVNSNDRLQYERGMNNIRAVCNNASHNWDDGTHFQCDAGRCFNFRMDRNNHGYGIPEAGERQQWRNAEIPSDNGYGQNNGQQLPPSPQRHFDGRDRINRNDRNYRPQPHMESTLPILSISRTDGNNGEADERQPVRGNDGTGIYQRRHMFVCRGQDAGQPFLPGNTAGVSHLEFDGNACNYCFPRSEESQQNMPRAGYGALNFCARICVCRNNWLPPHCGSVGALEMAQHAAYCNFSWQNMDTATCQGNDATAEVGNMNVGLVHNRDNASRDWDAGTRPRFQGGDSAGSFNFGMDRNDDVPIGVPKPIARYGVQQISDEVKTVLKNSVKRHPKGWMLVLPDDLQEKLLRVGGEAYVKPLCKNNFDLKFHAMLLLEEFENDRKIQDLNTEEGRIFKETADEFGEIYKIRLNNINNTLKVGDCVFFKNPGNGKERTTVIIYANETEVGFKFRGNFRDWRNYPFIIKFRSQRLFMTLHEVVAHTAKNFDPNFLFPETFSPEVLHPVPLNVNWVNEFLNELQKLAVTRILQKSSAPLPYVVFGPPGTGKTVTLTETVLQLCKQNKCNRILVTSATNVSVNNICEKLIHHLPATDIIRIMSYSYDTLKVLPPHLELYSAMLESYSTAAMLERLNEENVIEMNVKDVNKKKMRKVNMGFFEKGGVRVVATTLSMLNMLWFRGMRNNFFSHILINEAGMVSEPELYMALRFKGKKTHITIIGDPVQIDPYVISLHAGHMGLSESMIARFVKLPLYSNMAEKEGMTVHNNRLLTQLTHNYRSLPEILRVSSIMFYNDSLISTITMDSEEGKIYKNVSRELGANSSLIFHSVKGSSYKEENGTSWCNKEEIESIVKHVKIIYCLGYGPDDVAIISPYRKQCFEMKKRFKELNIALPEIDTVNGYQGREKNIVLISTVRNDCSLGMESEALHFISAANRLNVSITRARAVLIIFGNAEFLANNFYWSYIFNQCTECACSRVRQLN